MGIKNIMYYFVLYQNFFIFVEIKQNAMITRNLCILLLFFLSSNLSAITKDSVNAVLEELDVVIADKMQYQSKKENKIEDLKLRLKNTSNDLVRFELNGDVFRGLRTIEEN